MLTQAVVGVEADLHRLLRRLLLRLITDLDNVIVGVGVLRGDVLFRHPLQLLVELRAEDGRWWWWWWRQQQQQSSLCRLLPLASLPHQPVHLRHGQEHDSAVFVHVGLALLVLLSTSRSLGRLG